MATSTVKGPGEEQGRWSKGAKEGKRTPALESGGKGSKSVLLMLSTDLICFHFLLTFVLLSSSISFYPQDFMTYHEM